ncbi:MAG TPA: hypothetical protein VIT65_29385 [Microlunatus sp.]
MVDSRAHLDLIDRAAPVHPVRVAIDVDASLWLGPLHLGIRRSPVHTPDQVKKLAQQIARRDSARLVGLMLYDPQIAGLPDASAAVRLVKRASEAELGRRRVAVLEAIRPYDIDRQTIAGAISTGTYGSGNRLGGLATQVRGLTLITGDGSVLRSSAGENARCWPRRRSDSVRSGSSSR